MDATWKFCPHDGTPIADGMRFCGTCGRDMTRPSDARVDGAPTCKPPDTLRFDAPPLPISEAARSRRDTAGRAAPFDVRVEWERASYPVGVDSEVRAVVRVKAASDRSSPCKRSHLVLLLDVSGSMKCDAKYPLVREALRLMMEVIGDGLFLTVILFSDDAEALCEAESAASVRARSPLLIQALEKSLIKFHTTQLSKALELAISAVDDFRLKADDVVPRIYVLTDGQLSDEDECYRMTPDLERLGAEINFYGFGDDFASESLKRTAGSCPGGVVRHIRDTENVIATFRHVADVSASIVASEMNLALAFSEGVLAGDLFAHRPTPLHFEADRISRGGVLTVDAGNLEAGREYVWAFEARLPEEVSTDFVLGTLGLSERRSGGLETTVSLRVPTTSSREAGPIDPEVRRVFGSLEDLRDRSLPALIRAHEARLEIGRAEGRDPAYIAALENVLANLRRGIRPEDMDARVVRHADAWTCTKQILSREEIEQELRDQGMSESAIEKSMRDRGFPPKT